MNKLKILFIVITSSLILSSCRGWFTEKPPIHPNPNLDWQAKYKAQTFVGEKPKHTVKYKQENFDKSNKGKNLKKIPIPVTKKLINAGQENYNIYCSTCHTKTGNGTKSLIAKRGWIPSNILLETSINKSDGELFDIIGYGIRTMPGYATKLDEETRWAIVAYVRSLQQIKKTKYYQLTRKEKQSLKK